MKKNTPDAAEVVELRKDTEALKRLRELEELVNVPPERGGYHFSEWERGFIASVSEQFDRLTTFTQAQRAKLDQIWHDVELRKRPELDEKPANLFSNLSPARQAEQRARAARVRLPWEK